MGLVELLPESVQQQVRDGAITAHVAMKYLVPVARSRPEDCRRMAEGFARYQMNSREAGQLYAAWRSATATVRERLLDEPQFFLKTQRQHESAPEIAGYVAALKQHSRKLTVLALRQLLRMVREYPREPLLAAVAEAARYGLYDWTGSYHHSAPGGADYFLLNYDPDNDPESKP